MMTIEEKVALVKTMCEETDDDIVSAYLIQAGRKICRKAFPFDRSVREVPEEYEHLQIEGAVYLLNKRGAEGQTTHTENSISRVYENADLPSSMMNEIVPYCGVI